MIDGHWDDSQRFIRVLHLSESAVTNRHPTGCPPLDELLHGGLEHKAITQVYGEPGAGKTNLALSTAVEAAKSGSRVLYVDTEGFPENRLSQLIPDEQGTIADCIQIYEAYDFAEQQDAVKATTVEAEDADLIVVDSATGFYRLMRDEDDDGETLRNVGRQLTSLLGAARRYDIPVLVTNQVYSDLDSDASVPLGGNTIGHWTSVILQFEQVDATRRRATLEKHHAIETGRSTVFEIHDTGIGCVMQGGSDVDSDSESGVDGAESWSRA